MSLDWTEAMAFALTLPGTELATYYGDSAVKVTANGRAFLSRGHEQDTSFVLAIDPDTIERLKESYPAIFWQSPHYAGWSAVLVRYDAANTEHVRAAIEQAYRWTAAKARTRPRKRK